MSRVKEYKAMPDIYKAKKFLCVWTDGSGHNRRPMGERVCGAGVYMRYTDGVGKAYEKRIVTKSFNNSTTARMELLGIYLGLCYIKPKDGLKVKIFCDNQYCIKSFDNVDGWAFKWDETDTIWDKKNPDLIEDILDKIYDLDDAGVELEFIWLRGHHPNPEGLYLGNHETDVLAGMSARGEVEFGEINEAIDTYKGFNFEEISKIYDK